MGRYKTVSKRPPNKRINSLAELQEAILKPTAKGIVNGIANATAHKLEENIQERVYDNYDPSSYERTYELLNSVKVQKMASVVGANTVRASAYIDPNEIHERDFGNPNVWNQHTGKTESFRGGIIGFIDTMERGSKGGACPRDGAEFIKETGKWLDENGASLATTIDGKIGTSFTADDIPLDILTGIKIVKKK